MYFISAQNAIVYRGSIKFAARTDTVSIAAREIVPPRFGQGWASVRGAYRLNPATLGGTRVLVTGFLSGAVFGNSLASKMVRSGHRLL